MKAIIANAVEAASADLSWKAIDRYSKDYIELQTKDKVKFYKTPDPILQKQLEVFDQVSAKKAAENPCGRRSSNRREPSPRARSPGTRTPTSAGAWPITITSARRPRRRKAERFIYIVTISHPGAARFRVADLWLISR